MIVLKRNAISTEGCNCNHSYLYVRDSWVDNETHETIIASFGRYICLDCRLPAAATPEICHRNLEVIYQGSIQEIKDNAANSRK